MRKIKFPLLIAVVVIVFTVMAIFGIDSVKPKPNGTFLLPSKVVYQDPIYSFFQTPETAPDYLLSDDNVLFEKEKGESEWEEIGKLSEITLSKENFDDRFTLFNLSDIRENNSEAYEIKYDKEKLNMVLKQKNGDYYICQGYYDLDMSTPQTPDRSTIRWIYEISVQNPDWGVKIEATKVTPTGLTLKILSKGGSPTGELQYGRDYHLEVFNLDDWQRVPYKDSDIEYAFTMEAYSLGRNSSDEMQINWEYMYGKLPKGRYRICKSITDFRATGDYDNRIYYDEFSIK